MSSELTNVRVEYRRPRANGLGGGWWVFGSFAGREWRVRFYGRDPVPSGQDAAGFEALPEDQRTRLIEDMLVALEAAQYQQIRRKAEAQRFRSGMMFAVASALRAVRPRAHHARPREVRPSGRRTARRLARAPASAGDDSEPPPPDVVRVAVASARLWAHIRRREARQRVAA